MATKSQQESEAPAKVYQLDAVDKKVDDALTKLDTIIRSIDGVATVNYVDTAIKTAKEDITIEVKELVKNEVKIINTEYRPIKKGALWFAGIIVTAMVGVVVTTFTAIQRLLP